MLAGSMRHGRIWLRCPYCGDSEKSPHHAHYSINGDGLYHCVRCGAGGRLNPAQLLKLVSATDLEILTHEEWNTDDFGAIFEHLLPGPGNSRSSALDRYHRQVGKLTEDAFLSVDQFGDPIGVALVGPKGKRMVGRKGIAYPGDDYLRSSIDYPIRLVEGPYDVLYPEDVCGFGLPDRGCLRLLKGHVIILCPDGDVWHDNGKLQVIRNVLHRYQDNILGVEILPNNKDPDEVPRSKRKYVPIERMITVEKKTKRQRLLERLLEQEDDW